MKRISVFGAAALFLVVGAIAPAYAQKDDHKDGGKPAPEQQAKPAQQEQQHAAQPQHAQQAPQSNARRNSSARSRPRKPHQRSDSNKPNNRGRLSSSAHSRPASQHQQQRHAASPAISASAATFYATGAADLDRHSNSMPSKLSNLDPASSSVPSGALPNNGYSALRQPCGSARGAATEFRMNVSAPTLAASTNSVSAVQDWLAGIPASSTAVFGSDLMKRGRSNGITPTTSTLTTLTVNTSSITRTTPDRAS